jgi:hypothetical protein
VGVLAPYVFYLPVVLYALWLGIRNRGLTTFTAANPAIEAGGFVGESKAAILRGLADAGDAVRRGRSSPHPSRRTCGWPPCDGWRDEHALSLPIVLKPDAGQRGSGVAIAKSWDEIEDYLGRAGYDVVAQAYVPGVEFGVFYVRRPSASRGTIFAITEKELPVVSGDGHRTLEDLILSDPAPCRWRSSTSTSSTPPRRDPGERPARAARRAGHALPGCVFLRRHPCVDAGARGRRRSRQPHVRRLLFRPLRRPFESVEALRAGAFKVLELNGVTSEATSIYDARNGLLKAYKMLFAQWRLAFEIGAENRARGATPTRLIDLIKLTAHYRSVSGGHV